MEKQQDIDEPYEIKIYNIELDKEKYLSNISENTIQFVEKKIKLYENKIDSEYNLRAYARNEHFNKHNKAKGYVIVAIALVVLNYVIYMENGLYNYTSLTSFAGLGAVGALLIYPSFFLFLGGAIVCIGRAIKIEKESIFIVDSYSMKNKKWDYVIEESKERAKIYEEEITRLKQLVKEMRDEEKEKGTQL